MTIFDYEFTTGHGKNARRHRHTMAAMESEALRVPSFEMWPEGFWSRVGSMLGGQDIDFDHSPIFSNAYVLKGDNETAIRDYFARPRLEFFESKTGLSLQAAPGAVLCCFKKRKPEQLRETMAEIFEVHAALTQDVA